MLKKIGGLILVVIIVALPLVAVIWLIIFDSEEGMAQEIGFQDTTLQSYDFSTVPQSVMDAAVEMATGLVGNSQQKLQNITDQLLAAYTEAKNSDVVVVFNSGGWGWNIAKATGWGSILDGIKAQLEGEGHNTLVLNYRRTGRGIGGVIREFIEAATRYPHKARDLATRINFLTESLPDLKVIIAGESTGTVISDKTMSLLKDDTRVYSIQTGTPFWHKTTTFDRTLLMNSNGATVDTFSYGDIPALVWATVKSWVGFSSPDDQAGNILKWLRAPGHDYSWQYPGVYNQVVAFIKKNFGGND